MGSLISKECGVSKEKRGIFVSCNYLGSLHLVFEVRAGGYHFHKTHQGIGEEKASYAQHIET